MQGTVGLLNSLDGYTASMRGKHNFLIGIGGLIVPSQRDAMRTAGADFSSLDLKSVVNEAAQEIERVGANSREWTDAKLVGL